MRGRNSSFNRRGSILDIAPIIVGLFFVGITVLMMIKVLGQAAPAFQDQNVSQQAKDLFSQGQSAYPNIANNFFAILFIGLPLVSASLAYLLDSNPIYFWLLFLLSAFFVIVGGVLGFIWGVIAGDGAPLAAEAAQAPIINWVLSHYALYALFIAILLLGAIFMRMRNAQEVPYG